MAEADEALYVDVPETDNHSVCDELSPYDIDDSCPSARADYVTRDEGPTSEARRRQMSTRRDLTTTNQPAEPVSVTMLFPTPAPGQSASSVPPVRSYRAPPGRAATRQTTTVAKRRVKPLRPILL